jgi:hypothetical protein
MLLSGAKTIEILKNSSAIVGLSIAGNCISGYKNWRSKIFVNNLKLEFSFLISRKLLLLTGKVAE